MKEPVTPVLIEFPESFESERLLIRAPQFGDGPALRKAINASLPALKPWMHWAQKEITPEEAETNVRKARCQFLLREDLRLHLFLKETGEMIGSGGLHRIDWRVRLFELGYWCSTPHTGKGYITESTAAIAEFALETLRARRLEIRVSATNERSAKIPPRLGFELESRMRNQICSVDGTLHDTLLFTRFPAEET